MSNHFKNYKKTNYTLSDSDVEALTSVNANKGTNHSELQKRSWKASKPAREAYEEDYEGEF